MGGNAVMGGQLPGPGPVAERLGGQGAHRTQIDDVAGQLGAHGVLHIDADLHVLAPARGTHFPHPGDFVAEAHTAGAVDAAGHVRGDERPDVVALDHALAFHEARQAAAKTHGHVLQLTLPALVADGTVQGMVDEQELHGALLSLTRQGRTGPGFHAIGHGGGAGRQGLGRVLHFHQAHAAVGRHGELLVVAEARHSDARGVRHLDEHLPRGGFELLAIDFDGNGLLIGHAASAPLPCTSCDRCGTGILPGNA